MKNKQLQLFDANLYMTQDGLNKVFSSLEESLRLYLSLNKKEEFLNTESQIRNLNILAIRYNLKGIEIRSWEESRSEWGKRANSLICKLYKSMAAIKVNEIGLQEADRLRQRFQRRLNTIGRLAAKRGQLKEEDGYVWHHLGEGVWKPRMPL